MLPDFVNKFDVHIWAKNLWKAALRQYLSELGLNSNGSNKILKSRLIRYIERSYFGIDVPWGPNDEDQPISKITSEAVPALPREDTQKLVDSQKIKACLAQKSETSVTQNSYSRSREDFNGARQSSVPTYVPQSSSLPLTMYMSSTEHKVIVGSHNSTLRSEEDGEHHRDEAVASLQHGDKTRSCTKTLRGNPPTYSRYYDNPGCDDNRNDGNFSRGRKRFRDDNDDSYENSHNPSEDSAYGRYRSRKIRRDDYDFSQDNLGYINEAEEAFHYPYGSRDNQNKGILCKTQKQGYEDVINNPIDRSRNYCDSGSDHDHLGYRDRVNDHMKSWLDLPDYTSSPKENSNEMHSDDYEKSNQRLIDNDRESYVRRTLCNRDDNVDVCENIKKENVSQGTSNELDSASQSIEHNYLETASNSDSIHSSTLDKLENSSLHTINLRDTRATTGCTGLMLSENMAVKLAKKWPIKFTGQDGCTVYEFIHKVNMYRNEIPITDVELLEVLPSWLEGRAAQWWNMMHRRWRNWSEFLTDFETMYAGPTYQKLVREELRLRTQGPKESLMDYLISVQNIMSHLKPPLSEREKLDLIMDNLHPNMYPYFSPKPFKSMKEVQEQMMVIDARRARARYYRVPLMPEDSLFPENAYKRETLRVEKHRKSI